MNARVKNRKLQAKTAIMIMAPKKAKALLWVVATKPLPVRLRSSVGVRRDGRASRILFFGGALRSRVWLGSNEPGSTGFVLRASSRAVSAHALRDAYLEIYKRAGRGTGSILDALAAQNEIDDLFAC